MNRLQSERSNLESEYEQLRNKQDALSQWESQLSEIIQWVSDEKDARAYLQALATKMTEELEYLKHTGTFFDKFKIVIIGVLQRPLLGLVTILENK